MQKNVGSMDKLIRVVLGVVIIGLGLYYKSFWGILGVVLIIVAAVGYCPLYSILKMNTCCKDNDKKDGGCCCG